MQNEFAACLLNLTFLNPHFHLFWYEHLEYLIKSFYILVCKAFE